MVKKHWGHTLCAVDLETTGLNPEAHSIIQIAVVPLGEDFKPDLSIEPFVSFVRARRDIEMDLDAAEVHGLTIPADAPDIDQVESRLHRYISSLGSAETRICPLAHNWAFESKFMTSAFGEKVFSSMFHQPRDSMSLALAINDRRVKHGLPPLFESVGLPYLCKVLGVKNEKAHDAYYDSLACAEVYSKLLEMDL